MTGVIFFIIALLASTIGAISGIGGGVLMKPILEAVSGESVEAVSFLSGCTVLAMAAVSMLTGKSAEKGRRTPSRELWLAVGAVAGGLIGKLLFDRFRTGLGEGLLGTAQSSLLALMVVLLLVYIRVKDRFPHKNVGSPAALALGCTLGMMSSFLGIGGGPFNLAVLSYFLSMDAKQAARCSIRVILFSQASNLILTIARGRVPVFSWPLLLCLICGGVLGALCGKKISARLQNSGVERLYTAVLIAVLLICGWNLYGYLA